MFAAGFATFATLYGIQALLPALADGFRLSPASAGLAVSVATAALAVSVVPLSTLSDIVGRTPVMTASLLVTSGLGLLEAIAPSYPLLLALRTLQGIALAGLPAVGMAYLAEEVDPRSLGFAMGLYVAGNGIGGLAGRLVASLVADAAGWRWALAVIGIASVACALAFRALIPRSARFTPRPVRVGALTSGLAHSFADPGLLRLYAVGMLGMAAFVSVYNYLGFRLLAAPFHLSQAVVGLIFIGYLAGSCASAATGGLVDRLGRRRVLWVMLATMLAGLALTLPDALVPIVIGVLVITASFFAAHAVASGWVGVRARRARAQASAGYLLCYYLGSSAGGWASGVAYAGGGWSATVAFTCALVALALVLGVSLRSLAPAEPTRGPG